MKFTGTTLVRNLDEFISFCLECYATEHGGEELDVNQYLVDAMRLFVEENEKWSSLEKEKEEEENT